LTRKNHNILKTLLLVLLFAIVHTGYSQTVIDSAGKTITTPGINDDKADSVMRVHSPRTASIRSAIIPGWGQVYNNRWWKVPIIYGALGTTGYIFYYNLTTYRDLRFAVQAKAKAALEPPNRDTTDLIKIKPRYRILSIETLRYNRDEYRRNIDYSVLVFALFWGLNVVDAAVDAHLKTFDVSPDLALKFKAGHSQMANTNGVSLVLNFK
jgi:hypothetical protein